MLKRYSRGFDLPPALRDSLIADDTAAAAFAALSDAKQQQVCEACAGMPGSAAIDEYIRQTESFICCDVISSGLGGFKGGFF